MKILNYWKHAVIIAVLCGISYVASDWYWRGAYEPLGHYVRNVVNIWRRE